MPEEKPILILYDGNCPLCCRKTAFLKRRNRRGTLEFTDIRQPEFQGADCGIAQETLEKQIHAVLPDGTVVSGMDVIRAAYAEIGLHWLAAPTGWPVFRPLFDRLYGCIARNRTKISRYFK